MGGRPGPGRRALTTAPGRPAAPPTPRLRARHLALLALLVRLGHLYFMAPTPVLSYPKIFDQSDMYLFDRWAEKIVDGDLLGRERFHYLTRWQLTIAPEQTWTRWWGDKPVYYKAPFYPYLIALLYAVFGDAALPLALLQILASAAAVGLLFRITERLFGREPAVAAALILALYGPAIHFDVLMLRGPWIVLTTLLATWRLAEFRARPGPGSALVLGAVLGATLLVNEGSTPAVPLTALLLWAWVPSAARRVGALASFALGVFLALSPVIVRNYLVGTPLLQLAVTGSTVYAVFNSYGASPYFFEVDPTVLSPVIAAGGGSLLGTVTACLRSFPGAADVLLFYLHKSFGLLIPWENPDNANFYYAAVRSPVLAVLPTYAVLLPLAAVGLGLGARRWRAALPLLPPVLTVLAAILLTLPLSRYRATLAVYLMPFAGLAAARAVGWARERRWRPLGFAIAAAAGVFLGARLLETRVVFAHGAADQHRYRPQEFVLGIDFYERQGRLAEASREALDLARLNPDRRLRARAMTEVARLQARLGRAAASREALAAAGMLAGDDPWVLLVAGDVYLTLGDAPAALDAYRSAAVLPGPDGLRRDLEARIRQVESRSGMR